MKTIKTFLQHINESYTDMWEIIDSNGVINSGTEKEMEEAFFVMTHEIPVIMEEYDLGEDDAMVLKEKWGTEWNGDLKLIQIHDIHK